MTTSHAGLHRAALTAGALVAAAAVLLGVLLGLGWLVTHVLPGTGPAVDDLGFDRWLADHRVPVLDPDSQAATDLCATNNVIAIGLAVAVTSTAFARAWWPAVFVVVTLAGETALFLTTAIVVGRPRPPVAHLDAALPPTSSFPSGHTAAATCLFGGIAVLVCRATRSWWRWVVVAAAVLLVVAVAASRLYRGAHYPTDVLGGAFLGCCWLAVTARALVPRRSAVPGPAPA